MASKLLRLRRPRSLPMVAASGHRYDGENTLANSPSYASIMQPLRLAMWSGPRNISTAMMRAWGNRSDTTVCDEPLYAHYLHATGRVHPGGDEVIAAGQTDWRKVVAWLTGDVPRGKRVFFQKHMAHHLLPEIDRGWL